MHRTATKSPGRGASPSRAPAARALCSSARSTQHCVFVVDRSGAVLRVIGSGDGAGVGLLNGPTGAVLCDDGTLIVTDRLNKPLSVFRAADVAFVRNIAPPSLRCA